MPALFDENNSEFAEDRQAVREYLGPELYTAAARSTINAHYTDPELVDAMWPRSLVPAGRTETWRQDAGPVRLSKVVERRLRQPSRVSKKPGTAKA